MRCSLFLLLLLLPLPLAAQQTYTLGPDSEVQNVPHGTVEKLVLPPDAFYPGTPHNVAIYLPPNAPATPLPYMIFLDGSQYLGNGFRTPTVLDNLIAQKAIPPMAAIFLDPGVLPAIRPDAQNRYERVFEYDSLSNRYVNFLMTEVLPEVAKRHALSSNADEHGIGGTSTGAVGAFVAAWHRPDQFHRVLSLIGTYVAMKGADTLPELIRKTEAKPLRIWMQDGANDHLTPAEPYGTFYAGTWPPANRIFYDALQFQGYDAKLTIGTGGHDTKQGGAELPEALRWLWHGYSPERGVDQITPHPPVAIDQPGWDKRGSVWATVDAVGNWEPISEGRRIMEKEAITKDEVHYIADGIGFIRWASTRRVGQGALQVPSPAVKSDAVALSPDQAMLVVTDPEHRHQWSMQLQAEGKPTNAEPFYRLEVLDDDGGATGAAFDSLGQVYFATALGVQVCEANGRVAMILNSPVADKPVTAVAFGGPDHDWLYAVADGKLFRRKMKVHAVPVDKPEKPPQPPL